MKDHISYVIDYETNQILYKDEFDFTISLLMFFEYKDHMQFITEEDFFEFFVTKCHINMKTFQNCKKQVNGWITTYQYNDFALQFKHGYLDALIGDKAFIFLELKRCRASAKYEACTTYENSFVISY